MQFKIFHKNWYNAHPWFIKTTFFGEILFLANPKPPLSIRLPHLLFLPTKEASPCMMTLTLGRKDNTTHLLFNQGFLVSVFWAVIMMVQCLEASHGLCEEIVESFQCFELTSWKSCILGVTFRGVQGAYKVLRGPRGVCVTIIILLKGVQIRI